MLAVLLLHLQCLPYKIHNNDDLTFIQTRLFPNNGIYFPELLATNDVFVFFREVPMQPMRETICSVLHFMEAHSLRVWCPAHVPLPILFTLSQAQGKYEMPYYKCSQG